MSKRVIRRALQRCGEKRGHWERMALPAIISGDKNVMDFVIKRLAIEDRSIRLLNRRLHRMPRFRIRWANLLAVLGASALFVWFIVHVLNVWSA